MRQAGGHRQTEAVVCAESEQAEPLRLHIGGVAPKPGWRILNIQPGPHVAYVGDCTDLSRFADGAVAEVYAAHVYEHLSYNGQLFRALGEVQRVLAPGGVFRVSVPDFEVLCRIFLLPELNMQQRFEVVRLMFGGQVDPHDFHKVGLTWEFLGAYLRQAGFTRIKRCAEFGIFEDCSGLKIGGQSLSLNVVAWK